MTQIKILLTGGGTGGHIYPLIAVVKSLRAIAKQSSIDLDIKYFGPKNIFSFYLTGEGIPIKNIIASKLRNYFSFLNFLDGPRFIWSLIQSFWKVFWFMPDVAFSKGGPGSLPVLLACHFYKIPIIIHESDSIPGKSNQIASGWAKIINLGFASASSYFKKTKAIVKVVGNPIREELLRHVDQWEARRFFNLNANKKTILVIGGSQGSVRINDFIFNNLEVLLEKYQIIHQVGNSNYQDYIESLRDKGVDSGMVLGYGEGEKNNHNQKPQLYPYPQPHPNTPTNYYLTAYFENNLPEAYAAADLVIARAGGETIFELAALGKPSILIPLPEAAQDHQKGNAYQYEQAGATIVVEQENLLINVLELEIDKVLNDPQKLDQMSAFAKKFYQPEAATLIAKNILEIINYY